MATLIVGFGYKAKQGKDSAAKAIIEARSSVLVISRYAFADALKREVNEAAEKAGGMLALFTSAATQGLPLPNGSVMRLPDWVKYDPNSDMTDPMSPLGKQRTLLQWWGSEYRREGWGHFYWVKKLKEQIEKDNPQVALVTDVRFKNEFLWVKAHRELGYMVKMERTGFVDLSTNPNHASECDLDGVPFDFTITEADGDMTALSADALTVFDQIHNRAFFNVDALKTETEDAGQGRL